MNEYPNVIGLENDSSCIHKEFKFIKVLSNIPTKLLFLNHSLKFGKTKVEREI